MKQCTYYFPILYLFNWYFYTPIYLYIRSFNKKTYYCPAVRAWDHLGVGSATNEMYTCVLWSLRSSWEIWTQCDAMECRGSFVKAIAATKKWTKVMAESSCFTQLGVSRRLRVTLDFLPVAKCKINIALWLTAWTRISLPIALFIHRLLRTRHGQHCDVTKINEAWIELLISGKSLLLKGLHCFLHCHCKLKKMNASNPC